MNLVRSRFSIFILFFSSGVSGLMYEVVWLRMLSRIMGVTVYATSTVLAAFMAGLALGSFLLGKYIDKRDDPLKIYSILELLIGITALVVPFVFYLSVPIYQGVYQLSGEGSITITIFRVIFSFLLLLIPTTMMGGTLPVLTSYLVKRENVFGKSFSILYGLNTLGAVAGVLLSGFVTIGALGELGTIFIGVSVNLLVSIMAFTIYRTEGSRKSQESNQIRTLVQSAVTAISPYSSSVRRIVLMAFAISGFTALAYEIIWTRQLILFLRTSTYAFSGMLSVFLIGIAIGSLIMNNKVDKLKNPLLLFGILEIVIALLSIFNLYLFSPLDSHFARRLLGLSSALYATVIIVFPLTFVFGMIFPIAGRSYAKSIEDAGSSVGWLYSANTIGCILGSLVAGFLLIPTLGSTNTVIVLALGNGALGLVLIWAEPGTSFAHKTAYAAIIPIFMVLVFGIQGDDPFLKTIERRISARIGTTWIPSENEALPDSHEIYFHKEGIEGTVTAFSINKFKQLWINGTGMTFLCTETKLIAHLPLMFIDNAKEFLAICFGMGTTVRSAALYPDLNITAVDLIPELFKINKYYHDDADEVLGKTNVHTYANDGRNFLLLSPKKYDVIAIDPAPPIWSAGTVNLYTREFFSLCKKRLSPTGTLCLWFPAGTQEEVKSLVKTFSSVFPFTTVWSGPNSWGYYLLGFQQEVNWQKFRQNVEKAFNNPVIVKDLVEWDESCRTPQQLYGMLLWDENDAARIGKGGVIISDNYPFTEFPLWRYLLKDRELWHPQYTLNINNWMKKPNWQPPIISASGITNDRKDL